MMKASYKYIALALAALLCSCHEEITPEMNESQVQISANITPCVLTRVTEDGKSFTDGDVIKVQNTDRENKNLATYTYSESTGKWSSSEDLYWDGEAANTFNAWYPATAAYDSFTIPADQTSGTTAADWMTATTSAKKADGAVNLSFNHHLSKITVTIDSWSNEYLENEKVANSLELRSLSDMMSNDGAVSGDDVPKWVKAYIAQANTSFVAIIAPATYASGDNIMQIYVNGSATPLAVKTTSALAIESGKAYRFKLSVGKDLAEITSDVTVDAWDDEALDDQFATSVEVSQSANCYIISQQGQYSFKTVKGNSNESVGDVASAEVLWESFGTDVTPNVGDLVKNVSYKNGEVTFQTADTFKEGNAVIAAKDASGNILWSWHIWFTDQPQEQVYYNNAGTMMDRNLGATSATPGDVGALGLLYQWGRKDPFLGSSSISEDIEAASTITWPSAVLSDASTGTIEYTVANPTSFIIGNDNNGAWYDSNSLSTDNILWTTSSNRKSIYDPCPSGWRISDGGDDGVWSKALGSAVYFQDPSLYDETNKGMNLSGKLGSDAIIWYPAACYRDDEDGLIYDVGDYYYSWTSYNSGNRANYTFFDYQGVVNPSRVRAHSFGFSARCAREVMTPSTPQAPEVVNLSEEGTANSYIVSQKGEYKFSTVKGNSSESVGVVASAEVLWESFGTDVTPNVGDLVKNVSYKNGEVTFQTADTFKEGNAVIAAKDASGNVLWSWHIWLTDEPQGQEYYNNAGTMMDRNLGATSATPGDVGALGLFYQWGRKDPFLGSSSISESVEAASTIIWSSAAVSDSSNGTIEYATANPTVFITYNSKNSDWYYTNSSSADNTRWTTSSSNKSIYDPCPAGWRVPDGGALRHGGVWSMTLGSSDSIDDISLYSSTNKGINFSGRFGDATIIWYPASGFRTSYSGGSLYNVGSTGESWSATPNDNENSAFFLYFDYFEVGGVYYLPFSPAYANRRADGRPVRCAKEVMTPSTPSEPEGVNLSGAGTANSYIVSSAGSYKFSTVKGNSSESVGAVASAEVLWESFGTDVTPNVGDLVKNVSYKNGEVTFQTADTFKEGNAVIAAKDASGNILWSWHVWLTDEPQGQVYYNNAGTMMDRNLGATSATPGDVGALGLLYQWGRKDPFLGSSSISSNVEAKSTITWPSVVESNSTNGTIEYASANPTTVITGNSNNSDWYYTGDKSTDNTRWTESDKSKSIYDPCPAGWRVPDGGADGIWSSTLGSSSYFKDDLLYDSTNEGMNFSGKFGSASTIWYPASGCRDYDYGSLYDVGSNGNYWSASPNDYVAYRLLLNGIGYLDPSRSFYRAFGYSVRCVRVIDEVAGANAEE